MKSDVTMWLWTLRRSTLSYKVNAKSTLSSVIRLCPCYWGPIQTLSTLAETITKLEMNLLCEKDQATAVHDLNSILISTPILEYPGANRASFGYPCKLIGVGAVTKANWEEMLMTFGSRSLRKDNRIYSITNNKSVTVTSFSIRTIKKSPQRNTHGEHAEVPSGFNNREDSH